MWYASDEPIPSSTSTPKVSSQRSCNSFGSASPADVHKRTGDMSGVRHSSCPGWTVLATICAIIVGTFTRIVGLCSAISSKIRSGVERSGKTIPAAPTPNGKSAARSTRVPEEELRNGEDDVVGPEVEDAARVPLEAEHRAVRRVDCGLRLPRRAGRELPERDVVLGRRSRLELRRGAREPLGERAVHDEDLAEPAASFRRFPDRRLGRLVGDDDPARV